MLKFHNRYGYYSVAVRSVSSVLSEKPIINIPLSFLLRTVLNSALERGSLLEAFSTLL